MGLSQEKLDEGRVYIYQNGSLAQGSFMLVTDCPQKDGSYPCFDLSPLEEDSYPLAAGPYKLVFYPGYLVGVRKLAPSQLASATLIMTLEDSFGAFSIACEWAAKSLPN